MSRRPPPTIHSLPVELLSHLFSLGAHPPPWEAPNPFVLKPDDTLFQYPSSAFQITVSHVCAHWRTVALSTPQLWRSIHIREPSHLPRAQEFLRRITLSASAQLSIAVDTVARKDHIPGVTLSYTDFHSIFDIIVPYILRWRSFALKVCDQECKLFARERLSTCGPAPNLETLQLYHFEDFVTAQNLYIATNRPPVLIFDGGLPKLRNVSLIGVHLPWEHVLFLKDLHSLELALHSENVRPSYEQWERMLRSSPHLEQLSLHYSGPRVPSSSPTIPTAATFPCAESDGPHRIHLPSLHELSLTDLDPDYLILLFKHFSIPALHKLSLDLSEQDFTPFITLAAPSLAHVKSLVLTSLECSDECWRVLLGSLRELRELEVDFKGVGEGFLGVLRGDRRCPVLPSLESITLSGLSGTELARLIEYREAVRCGVQRWCVRGTGMGRDDVLERLVEHGWESMGEGEKRRVVIEWEGEEGEDDDDDDEGDDNGDNDNEEEEEEGDREVEVRV